MTNAEKFLKDGASIDEVAKVFEKFCENFNNFSIHTYCEEMREFLRADCKFELTEDERVILRNIDKKFIKIGRDGKNATLYFIFKEFTGKFEVKYYADVFDNVFQFIKERRRILY